MSTAAPLQTLAATPQRVSSANQSGSLLQRQCSTFASVTGECEECKNRQLPPESDGSPQVQRFGAQRQAAARPGHDFSKVQVHPGTGMPSALMTGLQQLSGADLSRVRVHYNSPRPSHLDALAFTHGTDIHVAPGQERHLPHEGWHVVQQLQGRVKPTRQLEGLWLNDNAGLESEADAMGARAQAVGAQAATAFQAPLATDEREETDDTDFAAALAPEARLAAGGGEETDDMAFTAALAPEARPFARSRGATAGSGSGPVFQRAARFAAGTIASTTNLAAHVIAGNRDMGFTPPTLNGTTCLSAAAAQGAITAPTLGAGTNPDGTANAFVTAVGANVASFTMTLPSAPRWSTVTAKANVAALFASLGLTARAGCATAGNSTFRFRGRPTDARFAANVRTHEDLHVADHRAGFSTVIVPWDASLEAARTAGTRFNGATAADAEAALYTAMGGTPNQIAAAQFNTWIALNNTTHGGATLATGGTATPSNSRANRTCTKSSMDAT